MIELQHVTFNYSAQGEQGVPPALRDVSLRLHEGETVAIIGHNGSGKSTLTRLLAAILQPQQGSVLVDGLRTDAGGATLWEIRQRVGIVFQNPDDQLIAGTVIDDIAFGPENLGLPREEIQQRVQEAIALLDLEGYEQMAISELSLSLKQRVAIAGVLAMQPRYLILDEPTTMISARTARQLLGTVQRLARERGIGIIHITHFMHEITGFDRIIVMDAGRILMDGTPRDVFARTNELQAVGLDVPLVTQLGRTLKAQGWTHIPEVVFAPEQLLSGITTRDEHPKTENDAVMKQVSSHADVDEHTAADNAHALSQANSAPLFELRKVSYTYLHDTPFAQTALHKLSLSLYPGRTTALIGPTGSGKSTLIDMLAGLIKPGAGVFLFRGMNTADSGFKVERIRSQVGIVFQAPESQIFEETVGKDVSFGPRQKRVSLAESRRLVRESLEAVGLSYEDFRTRYTYALSGGEKRRVAIAGVLALQPEVIIFDEPMAGLDPRGRVELLDLLRSLKQRDNLTIIYASSSLQYVIELADVVHVLERGQLALSGSPREVLAKAAMLRALDVTLPEVTRIALTLRKDIPALRTDILSSAELEHALLMAYRTLMEYGIETAYGTEYGIETSSVPTEYHSLYDE
jgi:energy-coupling factor transport system ATP-binding protein